MPSSEFDPVVHQSDLKLLRQELQAASAQHECRSDLLRQEMSSRIDLLRAEMLGRFEVVDQQFAALRQERIADRVEMDARFAALRAEMEARIGALKAELIRFMFSALIAQAAFIVGLVKFLPG